jgi:hypothetical protein
VAVSIRERAAGVAGVEGGVGLDDVLDDASGRRERAPERRDHARRNRAGEAVGIPDRDDELTDAKALSVAELGRGEVARFGAQDGQVRERIGPGDLDLALAAVDEGRARPAVALRDDMRGSEHVTVGRDDDGASAAREPAPSADAPRDAEVGHRRRQTL